MTRDKTNWEKFFDAHAPIYMDNVFTKNTIREVDFLLDVLALQPGDSILDVGCGTGRHAIELAKRGYEVTGLDLSEEMLKQAEAGARAAGVELNLIHADAARFSPAKAYDAVICLCEGSFGLLGRADDPIDQPLAILCNISRSLKPQASVLMTVLNGAHMIRKSTNDDVAKGRFDPLRMVESTTLSPREDLPAIAVRERAFVPTELALLCRLAGLTVIDMWGGTAGNWGKRSLDLDEIEIMVAAQRTADPAPRGMSTATQR
ncbi:MAG: methyltransferase domain-containing protein [Candidatus Eisenbacteria bacterium]|nr:methyltransferase domain-containing protein [Candidatus Eisenbacteria bacterium]